ncbi:hypothetical protein LR48_Vigan272s001800 [Vigna angularis]|uniref:Uncharacterized protein n=1 Tax=Phaseolus angularis TaxID=3914 RepID=A0A0L9T756_PHAAN|nr:hypothetical protein LR48_Vigan272s001800 [Vigna angularis]
MKAQTGELQPDYAAICQDYAAIRQDYAAIRQDLQEIIRMLGGRGHNQDGQHWDLREEEEGERGDERHEVQPSGERRVVLPVFKGFDLMGWIARAETVLETQGRDLTHCRCKWHALLSDYYRFKRSAAAGGKLSPNFDYKLFEAVKRVVRACEERGMADPESDTEAGNDARDTTVEIGSKRKGQRSKFRHRIQKPKLEQRHEDNHEEEREEKPFFSWVKREKVQHKVVSVEENNNKSSTEGVAEQAMSGVEIVKVVDVATENQEEKRGLAVHVTPAKGRELLEVLKDIEVHFLTAYDAGKEVIILLEVNRIREE